MIWRVREAAIRDIGYVTGCRFTKYVTEPSRRRTLQPSFATTPPCSCLYMYMYVYMYAIVCHMYVYMYICVCSKPRGPQSLHTPLHGIRITWRFLQQHLSKVGTKASQQEQQPMSLELRILSATCPVTYPLHTSTYALN